MLTQVVGRSGRGSKAGRAVIQTYTPENPVIKLAASQDYDGFYNREIQMRILAGSPPVRELFSLTASGMSEASVLRMCVKLKKALSYYLADFENVSVMGPAPASIIKINNRYRYKITVSCENTQKIRNVLSHIVKEASKDKTCRGVSVYVDVDAEE
jgi:primosomal protein N' (replication factor Y)